MKLIFPFSKLPNSQNHEDHDRHKSNRQAEGTKL